MSEVLIGRQPIFDAHLEVRFYELAFRYGVRSIDAPPTPSAATARVLTDALTAFGLDALVGTRPATVNVGRDFILSNQPLPVSPDRIVLEVSAREGADPVLLAGLEGWRARGFKIAIDDVQNDDKKLEPLFARADVLKVDCLGKRQDDLSREVGELRRHRKRLLAEKIETRKELELCQSLGFEFFQGYFLERPGLARGHSVDTNRGVLMRLTLELQDPACDFERIETIVRQDVGLSYRILRCVNSAAFGIPRQIESLQEAVIYLGTAAVRNLACLLLLSAASDQPRELLRMAMFRARLCELVCAARGVPERSKAFTVGLLSLFDALLGVPMPKLLPDLPLALDVQVALLEHRGDSGEILGAVMQLERAQWGPLLAFGLDPARIQQCWFEAVQWVSDLDAQIAQGAR